MSFSHLHLHSEHSALDGYGTSKQYISRAKELGMKSISITDHGTLAGCLKWQQECDKQGIQPILGSELYIVPDAKIKNKEKSAHILILVTNHTGWIELSRILTYANLIGFHKRPRIDFETLLNSDMSGWIITTACVNSWIKLKGADSVFKELKDRIGGRLYLEIMPHAEQIQIDYHKNFLLPLWKKTGLPLIATNDCFVENTPILTKDGYKFIEEIKNNDFVLTHKKRFRKVIHSNRRKLNKNEIIYRLKTPIGSIAAEVTENHPYYICDYPNWQEMKNFRWSRVKNLEIGNYLLIPKLKNTYFCYEEAKQIDALDYYRKPYNLKESSYFSNEVEYVKTIRTDKKIKIPRFINIDDKLLLILGMYIANGNEYKNLISISVKKSKTDYLVMAKKYFERFNLHPELFVNDEYSLIRFTSVVFSHLFVDLCGKCAYNKKLPLKLKLSKKQLCKLLEGYILCDGHCGSALMVGATTSKKLAFELSLVLNSIGFLSIPSIQYNDQANKNWKRLYYLLLSGNQAYQFNQLVNLEKRYSKPKIARKRYIENDDYYGVKLIKKEKIDYKKEVFNLEVEEDNSYIANNYIVHNCHYVLRGDWKAQECLLAIQRKAKWDDPNRWKFEIKGLHLRSETEMKKAFERQAQFKEKEVQEALENTIKIAEQCCNFRIPKQEINLPKPPFISDKDENVLLDELCLKAIDERNLNDDYKNQYKTEFKLIKKKGFARYFLIVHNIIQYCKKEGIAVGPGRGSIGGSTMANLLGITRVDPLKFNLSFSRFLSEERNDWPDIDMDVEDSKRDQVVEYIQKTYGKNNVCGISTDNRMQSRSVIWDVGRVFDIPSAEIKKVAQCIRPEDDKTAVNTCIEEDPIGQEFKKTFPDAARLAVKLEGQLRYFGQHPAAVIICNDDLTSGKYGPLRIQKGNVVSAWDVEDSEYNGLMKLDILGLATLSILSECTKLISKSEIDFDLDKIPLDDKEVFKQLSEGKTSGVFQFNANQTTQLCKKVGIDSFNDMVAVVALVRPGPAQSGMTENFIRRKHGEKWKPLNLIYEEITKDTYGLIVYQEQVMQVISKVAGLSESTADKIRKVIGKKRDAKEFEPYRIQFLEGCKKQKTLSQKESNEFWEGLKEHAHYSFNKSHSVEYAMIGYQTCWLRIYYPAEFICACLTHSKTEKQILIDEAFRQGFKIILPKVGISDATKWIIGEDGKTLYAPFIEVNSIGQEQAKKVCTPEETSNVGFFNINPTINSKTELGRLLSEIGANDLDSEPSSETIQKHFQFILSPSEKSYPKLTKLIGHIDLKLEDTSDIGKLIIHPTKRFQNQDIKSCEKCELRQECESPVLPSSGIFNVFIVGEAPGNLENKYGKGFYEKAPAGKLLWKELKLYELERRMFFTTNICKCYPSQTGAPKPEHIKACLPWFKEEVEIIQPRLILAMGNTCVRVFKEQDGGIQKLSGTTEWNEEYGFWICWCIHPAAVARNSTNQEYFERGVRNFFQKFKLLIGKQ